MRRLLKILGLGICLCICRSGFGATLIIDYDVNNPASWTGSQVKDLENYSAPLVPGNGTPRTQSGPDTTPADYAAPVYVASGAQIGLTPPLGMTVRNRAYLDFQKFGTLDGSSKDSSAFNTPTTTDDGTHANLAGFTIEGFLRINTGYTAAENAGFGISHSGSGVGLIRINRGSNSSMNSNTSVDNTQGGGQNLENIDTNVNAIIPLNQWFDIIKVHDPVNDQVRIYINGVLLSTTPLDTDNSAVEYHPGFVDQLGDVGLAGRELKGVAYSTTRFWRGPLTPAEVEAAFIETAFVPEPASMGILAMIGASMVRRRK